MQAQFQPDAINPLARLVIVRDQRAVYPLGVGKPPSSGLDGYNPSWQVLDLNLGALATLQVRVTLPRMFTLLAMTVSNTSNVSGGFRAQIYDVPKKRRLSDRGVQQALMGGNSVGGFFLREPYPFDLPNHQILVIAQNFEAVANAVQIILYGMTKRNDQK